MKWSKDATVRSPIGEDRDEGSDGFSLAYRREINGRTHMCHHKESAHAPTYYIFASHEISSNSKNTNDKHEHDVRICAVHVLAALSSAV